ncbi:MAG: histidinol-phosphate transaminase [Geminicoccaceae bacterium]|nr:MAG: histidinol-phosphate transaminase [Geminicoccaceae bacterium]
MITVVQPALVSGEPYVPGLSRSEVARRFELAPDAVAKLGSAENPFGPSPKAVLAMAAALADSSLYPNWTAEALRRKIAERFGLEPNQVVAGSGETELIGLILRTYAAPGAAVLMQRPCFPIYHLYAENEGRRPVFADMGPDFAVDTDRYVAQLQAVRPSIAFVTHPHSPTGQAASEADLRRIAEAAPDTLVVLDEAYVHYTETEGLLHLVGEYPNLMALRTFSKAYGLAGLRVGFAVGAADLIRPLWNAKPTWNIGALQSAGAIAALDDEAHVQRTVQTIVAMRAYVTERLAGLRAFRMVPNSRANFFLLEVVSPALDSTGVFEALLARGVIVKDGSVSFRGLGDRYLRIDVGLEPDMDRLVSALADIERSQA